MAGPKRLIRKEKKSKEKRQTLSSAHCRSQANCRLVH